ncbi:MAG: transcription elongation factor GreA [Gammaproteobacteria bacterium]
MNKVPMTVYGAEKLREELEILKHEKRPAVIQAIAEARAHGDLKENAEYHAARDQQSFIEGRIKEVEYKLSLAQIVDISKIENNGKVIFGSTVEIINLDTDEKVVYQIVGEDEANLKQGKISVTSPIARALIGKMLGDEVNVHTPSGNVSYEVADVKYI